jgi:hypothetical protein
MTCCKNKANNGRWLPLFNDCHTSIDRCIEANGLMSPPHYRMDPPEFDGTQFP